MDPRHKGEDDGFWGGGFLADITLANHGASFKTHLNITGHAS